MYGYRKVSDDIGDLAEICGKHCVYRLMRHEKLRSQTGYHWRPGSHGRAIAAWAPNHLRLQFNVTAPNRVWDTDITYIRTPEGWLFLAAMLDLCSRQVIGWSMGPRIDRELAINALLMPVWRRQQPKQTVMVHSDQGSQFSSDDWQDFCQTHNLQQSMSRRGNCHDNAVAKRFFQFLKCERIKHRTYATREEGRADVFDYIEIEMFYNPKRRHNSSGGFPQSTTRSNIPRGSKVSRISGAVQ